MSCGCSGFDGEAINEEMDGLEFHHDNFTDDEDFDNVVTDGLDWTSEEDIMRDGMEFGDERNPMLNFDGRGYTDFVDDLDNDEFDNFLTKKMRERRRVKKDLIASGLSKADAKKQALEQIPRDKLKDIIARLKAGKQADTSGLTADQQQAVNNATTNDVSSALTNQGGGTGVGNVADGGLPPQQAGFFAKNKMAVYGGIALVVIVGGYFAYKKFGKG